MHITDLYDFFSLQIVNGYFVHFFAPPDLPRVPKNVVFVIDRSGSMGGRKIQQVRLGECDVTITDRERLECVCNPPLRRDHYIVRQCTFYLLQFYVQTHNAFFFQLNHTICYSAQSNAAHKYTHIN